MKKGHVHRIEKIELGWHYEAYKNGLTELERLAGDFPEIRHTEHFDELLGHLIAGRETSLAQINYGPSYMLSVYRKNGWDCSWAEEIGIKTAKPL